MTSPRSAITLLALLPLACSLSARVDGDVMRRADPVTSDATVARVQEDSYREDVRDYTYACVDAENELLDFDDGLGVIAERHGVSDWEAADATYVAIGAGLARAQVSSNELADLKRTLGRADPLKMTEIQRGFDRGL